MVSSQKQQAGRASVQGLSQGYYRPTEQMSTFVEAHEVEVVFEVNIGLLIKRKDAGDVRSHGLE